MKFKFPLEKVLEIRRHEENTRQRAYARCVQEVERIKDHKSYLHGTIAEFATSNIEMQASSSAMQTKSAYLLDIHKQIHNLTHELKEAEKFAEKARLLLVEANKKTKMLEKLKENQLSSFVKEQNRLEMLEINELATIRYNRLR